MRLLCHLLLYFLLLASVGAVNDVVIKYNKLFVDGKEYIVKGMSYQPTPIGMPAQTGLCSVHATFVDNQYLSACYDSDYFDGYNYPDHQPPAPADGWFAPIWERDLPKMAAIGVNTIRLYNVNPSNYLAYERYAGQYFISKPGKDHIPFLDACQKYGIKVLWPLFADYNYLNQFPEERLEFYMRTAIEEVGNHPALLMYAVGNELNYVNNSDYNSWVKTLGIASRLMNYARDYQRTYWNRMIPFTTGTDDNNLYYDWLAGLLPVDVFMPNAGYRGQPANGIWNFYDLWSGADWQGFSGWYKLSCKYQIPLLIGEMNPLGYENPPPGQEGPYPDGFPQLWRDLMQHVSQGAIGGFFFEWNDEPAKGNQNALGIHSVSVTCNAQGCSDQTNVYIADTLTDKAWEVAAISSGTTTDGKPWNYGSDIFAQLGRAQQTLATAQNNCPANYWDGETYLTRGNYTSQYVIYNTSVPTIPPSSSSPPTSRPPTSAPTPSPSTVPPVTSPPPSRTNAPTTLPPPSSKAPATNSPRPSNSPSPRPSSTVVFSTTSSQRDSSANAVAISVAVVIVCFMLALLQ